jgi:hypothetical protein
MMEQDLLFECPAGWEKEWVYMPEYNSDDLTPYRSVYVHFSCDEDFRKFEQVIGQKIIKYAGGPGSVWFPKAEIGKMSGRGYNSDSRMNPDYPVYIISKGRWETRLTSKALEKIGVPYHIVIEPQEYDQYASVIDKAKILVLPFSNLGQGSIPARNWVWEHSIEKGTKRHWILDDNISGFYRLNNNLKLQVYCGNIFRAAEDFAERYENIALSGFDYFMFQPRKQQCPPYTLNTRIYSCILIKNDLPYRWRGRYNEDTDLSIRALKDGWCTVLFNTFLAMKSVTMTMAGGNTDELYQDDGRLKMVQSLKDQHPDIVAITEKWGRPQHTINYHLFNKNKLVRKPDLLIPDGVNNYGMTLRYTKEGLNGNGIDEDAGEIMDRDREECKPVVSEGNCETAASESCPIDPRQTDLW